MFRILNAQRYITIVGDNVFSEVLGVFVETLHESDEGGDVITNHQYTEGYCRDCDDKGPAYHWCVACQDGTLYVPRPTNYTTVTVG